MLKPNCQFEENGDEAILRFEDSLTFFSVLKQKDLLQKASRFKHIRIDLSKVSFIDATSISLFSRESSKFEKNGALVYITIPTKFELIYKQIKDH